MSGGILASSLLTHAKWGAISATAFKTHLAFDVANGLLAASAPWLFGFSENRRARSAPPSGCFRSRRKWNKKNNFYKK